MTSAASDAAVIVTGRQQTPRSTNMESTFLAELVDFLLGHGHTKAANDLADYMDEAKAE